MDFWWNKGIMDIFLEDIAYVWLYIDIYLSIEWTKWLQKKGNEETMIHQYEIDFSVVYGGKEKGLQSAIIPANSLEEANKKLKSEVKRRFGKCYVRIHTANLYVSEDSRYAIV